MKLLMSFCLLLLSLPLWASGFLIVMPDGSGNGRQVLFPLENRSTQVEVEISDFMASTSIKQTFYNPTNSRLEAYFLFPVPKEVVIQRFAMTVNGKMQEAELLDAKKAKQIYEQIVRQAKDPALLEYYNQELFKVRIFPIEPRSEQKIELTYHQALKKDDGGLSYRLPMNSAKFSAKPIQNISLRLKLKNKQAIKNVYSPSHEIELIRKGEKAASVGFEQKNVRPDRDFELYWRAEDKAISSSLLQYQKGKEDGYFFLNLSPGWTDPKAVMAKDVVFVFDKSGSMSGKKMEQAQKALKFCVDNLGPEDRFELIPYSTEAQSLFGQLKSNSKTNREEAKEYIDELRAIGGTNIEEALQMALDRKEKKAKRPFFVIFMTDGKPTIGEIEPQALLDKLAGYQKDQVRIFTFGIGSDINTKLLDQMTEMSKGYRDYALEDEDLELKLSNFYLKAASPVLSNIELVFDKNVKVEQLYPRKTEDLFRSESLNIMGRYKGEGPAKLQLKALVNGEEKTFEFQLDFKKKQEEHSFIPDLWALRAVGYLLDQIRFNGEQEELKQEVIRLAKKHGIITPYTSYLIVEDQPIATNPGIRPIPRRSPQVFQEELDDQAQRDAAQGLKESSGTASVRASRRFKKMNQAQNMAEMEQERAELNNKDLAQDNASAIVNRSGRALYRQGNNWVDANYLLLDKAPKNLRRVAFNSKEYFKLLQEDGLQEILALGNNITFEWKEEWIEIYE